MKFKYILVAYIIWVFVFFCHSVFADTKLTIKITVLAPPCVINENNLIDVDFGSEVVVSKVDEHIYVKPVNFDFNCSDNVATDFKFQIEGTGSSFDKNILRTNNKNLGVRFLSNNNEIDINKWVDFNINSKPQITALLIQNPKSDLAAGDFSTGATLKVDYQ